MPGQPGPSMMPCFEKMFRSYNMSTTTAKSQTNQYTFLSIFCLACLSLMFAAPFIVSYQTLPIVTFHKEWIAAFFAVLAALYLLVRIENFQFPLIAFMPIALMLILGVQIAVDKADYWQNHYLVMLYLGMTALLMVIGANLKNALGLDKIVPVLSWTLVVMALAVFATILIGLTITDADSFLAKAILTGRAGNIGQVNHFSNYVALATGSLSYLLLTKRIKFLPYLLIATVFMLALALAGQRMAIIYVFVLSIGGWLLAKTDNDPEIAICARKLLWLIPIFIVVQCVLPYLSFLNPSLSPVERLAQTAGGSSTRLMIMQQAWELFKTNPLLGAGWQEFAWYNFNQTENYPDLKGIWNHAHNLLMQLLAEMGVFAALILLIACVFWLIAQRNQKMNAERWWVLALLSVLAIHSMLEYPLWYTYFLAIAALLLGLGEQHVFSCRFRLAPIMFTAVFIFGSWSLGNLLFHYHSLHTTLTEFREGNVENAQITDKLVLLNKLRKSSPLTAYIDNVIIRVLPDHPDLLADKLTINTRVVEFWPGKVESYTQATLLALNDQPEAAEKMMLIAAKKFPEYRKVYLRQIMGKAVRGETRLLPLIVILQESPVKIIQR